MFGERRRRFCEAIGPDAVAILLGARPATRSADTPYPFRQDSDFWYLTGFDHPNAAAILRTTKGPTYTLYVEPRNREAEIWTGSRPGIRGAVESYGADEAHAIDDLSGAIPRIVEGARRVYCVLGRDSAIDAALVEVLDGMRLRSRTGVVPPEAIFDPRNIIHEMRLIKDETEIETMRRAGAISCEAHRAAARLAHGGNYEYELEAVIDYAFRRRGATGPAYPSIVGGGKNATVLHYVANDQKLENGELVLIDAGCELEGYASDVTRTYPIGGRFTDPGRAVYEVVLAAQRAALDVARPGATLADAHQAAVRRLTEGMIDLGLMSGNVEELLDREAYKTYYMHRTSHWLGLDVHDVGAYTVDGEARALEPGMVFTIEPGIYVAPDTEDAEVRFRGIGVRIEDDVLITPDGREVLTAAIPKDPEEIEAWVNDR